jgi:hypothetical protein
MYGIYGHPTLLVHLPTACPFLCVVLVVWRRIVPFCEEDAAPKISTD